MLEVLQPHDRTRRSFGGSLGVRALLATAMFEAIPTMYPDPARVKQTPRGQAKLRASRSRGLGFGSMVNISEPMINLVNCNMPKMLTGMNQKVRGGGLWTGRVPEQGQQPPPGDSRHLTFQLSLMRNMVSPYSRPSGQSEPQGTPMGMRVWDAGKSECRAVIVRIGVEEISDIIPPEREQTSGWFLLAREFAEPSQRRTGK